MSGASLSALLAALAFLSAGFFAGAEIGLVSCDRIRLRYLSESGSRPARALLGLLARADRTIAVISLGANLSSVLCSALVTSLVIEAAGAEAAGPAITVFILVFMVFAEIVPKAVFRGHADLFVLWSAYPLVATRWVLGPGASLLHAASATAARLLRVGRPAPGARFTREELAHFLERSAHAGSAGRRWFRAVLGISEKTAGSVAVPLAALPAARAGEPAAIAADRLREGGGSFILVTRDEDGAPLGTVGVHDLLDVPADAPVGVFVRPAPVVPAERRIEELLPEIQAGATPLALVAGRGGRIVGIATHEAIAFAIVGTIEEARAGASPTPASVDAAPPNR